MSHFLSRRPPIHFIVILGLTVAAALLHRTSDDFAWGAGRDSTPDDQQDLSSLEGEPLERAPGDDDLRWLMKQKLNFARRVRFAATKRLMTGVPGVDTTALQDRYVAASERVAVSQLDLATTKKERIEALEGALSHASWHEKLVRAGVAQGKMTDTELSVALYERLDAQIKLSRELAAQ